MEKIPSPESSSNKKPSFLEKGVKTILVGGALLAGTVTADAQTSPDSSQNHSISIEQQPSFEKDSARIIKNLESIEAGVKSLTKHTAKKDQVAYAILSTSDVLGQVNLLTHTTEKHILEDVEQSVINNPTRNYQVLSRSPFEINSLLSERALGKQYHDRHAHIFEMYTPVDFYLTVGVEVESDDSVTVVIRKINMQTKSIELFPINTGFSNNVLQKDIDADHAVTKQIETEIQKIISSG